MRNTYTRKTFVLVLICTVLMDDRILITSALKFLRGSPVWRAFSDAAKERNSVLQPGDLDLNQDKLSAILGPNIRWKDKPDRIPSNVFFERGRNPEQTHISLGNDTSSIVVMWATGKPVKSSPTVRYGFEESNMSLIASGTSAIMYIGNLTSATPFQHRVVLENLKPDTTYFYQIVCSKCFSIQQSFKTLPNDQSGWSPNFLVFGDMGRLYKAPILKLLKKDALSGKFHMVLHVGDFAYDLRSLGGLMGDSFMRQIDSFASKLPYMTCPGNHETNYFDNVIQYVTRFSMPQSPWPMIPHELWYSMNIGNIHFISYSSESFFYPQHEDELESQKRWLEKDLLESSSAANRSVRPWIIAFGHRPMYCSNSDRDDCTKVGSKVRGGLEELFFRHGVDLIIEAHEHSYERLWPVYNTSVWGYNYSNPGAPVHLVAGAAGCNEGYTFCVDPIARDVGPWSAFRTWFPGTYGYGRMKILNDTHLQWQQILAVNGQVADEFWLIQHHHGPFKKFT